MNFNLKPTAHYGIMLSGGLDSAVLLYLMLAENKNISIQPYTIPKHDGSRNYINSILDYMNQKFNIKLPDTILVGDPNLFHSEQGLSAIKQIKEQYPVNYLFFGSNQNPPVTLAGTNPIRVRSTSNSVVLPFFDLYKTSIIEFAIEHDAQELFNLTHSCTEQPVGRCNRCWQCLERAWAFNELNLQDTGTL